MMKKTNWPDLMRSIMERLELTRQRFGEALGASGKPAADKWMQSDSPPTYVQTSVIAALESLGSGFCPDAVRQYCLGKQSLTRIVSHIEHCPTCRLAARRIKSTGE